MSISIGASNTPAAIIPTSPLTASTAGANTAVDQGSSPTPPGDTITISLRARALQKWQQDDPSFQPPGDDATPDVKQRYEAEINAYEAATQRVDNTKLNSDFQNYADIINSSTTTDAQKLDAYSKFSVQSVISDSSFQNGYNLSDQTFKFNWLTRDSDFLKRIYSGPLASSGVSGVSLNQPHGSAGVEPTKDTTDHIADAVNFAPIQQAVLAINTVSANLIFTIINGNKASLPDDPAAQNTHLTPGFSYTGAKPVDTKTALAEAVAQTLQALNKSHVGAATDPKSLSYKTLFAQTIQNFQQQGLASAAQGGAKSPLPN